MHDIPELDKKGLREFGLVTGAIVAVLFGALLPWIFNLSYPVWPWIIGAVLALWALLAPSTLGPVYKWWMRLGLLLNRITTPLIMGVAFFLVIAPIGMLMRLVRHDPMARRMDEQVDSFRVISQKPPKENMEKPF